MDNICSAVFFLSVSVRMWSRTFLFLSLQRFFELCDLIRYFSQVL